MDYRTLSDADATRLKTQAQVLEHLYKTGNGKLSKGGKIIAKSFIEDAVSAICAPFQSSKNAGAKRRLRRDLEDSGVSGGVWGGVCFMHATAADVARTALRRAGIVGSSHCPPEGAVVLAGDPFCGPVYDIINRVAERLVEMLRWAEPRYALAH